MLSCLLGKCGSLRSSLIFKEPSYGYTEQTINIVAPLLSSASTFFLGELWVEIESEERELCLLVSCIFVLDHTLSQLPMKIMALSPPMMVEYRTSTTFATSLPVRSSCSSIMGQYVIYSCIKS